MAGDIHTLMQNADDIDAVFDETINDKVRTNSIEKIAGTDLAYRAAEAR